MSKFSETTLYIFFIIFLVIISPFLLIMTIFGFKKDNPLLDLLEEIGK